MVGAMTGITGVKDMVSMLINTWPGRLGIFTIGRS